MNREAHVAFSALLGLLAAKLLTSSIVYWYVGLVAGIVAGLVPDADLGWRHRMLLHNLFAAIGVALAGFLTAYWVSPSLGLVAGLASLLGFLGHIFLDSLTVSGVALLYPLSRRRYRLARLRSSSRAVNVFIEAVSMFLVIVVLYAL